MTKERLKKMRTGFIEINVRELFGEIDRLTLDLNTAIAEIYNIGGCDYCRHENLTAKDYPCSDCSHDRPFWKWRGEKAI